MTIEHDRLFKLLIETFFEEFMLLFFPQVHAEIDFSHLEFLSQELINDIKAGERRTIDLLVKTKLLGEVGFVLVHVEPQAYRQPDFNKRMFNYFSRLFEKYNMRILPIAVFSYNEAQQESDEFRLSFASIEVLRYKFLKVELARFDWRAYIHSDNPVAAALLSKMGYSRNERIQVKRQFLEMLLRLRLDPARMQLIAGFFETYLILSEEEESALREEIRMLGPEKEAGIMEFMTSWERKGLEKGKIEGKIEGKIAALQKYMAIRFGARSEPLQERVARIQEETVLDQVTEQIYQANHLEQAAQILGSICNDASS